MSQARGIKKARKQTFHSFPWRARNYNSYRPWSRWGCCRSGDPKGGWPCLGSGSRKDGRHHIFLKELVLKFVSHLVEEKDRREKRIESEWKYFGVKLKEKRLLCITTEGDRKEEEELDPDFLTLQTPRLRIACDRLLQKLPISLRSPQECPLRQLVELTICFIWERRLNFDWQVEAP